MLYIRMFVLMCISLFTGRVVLTTLGVEDYGIYNVVGGFVAMFSMISGSMVGATQRFLSFELGKIGGDVHHIFCTVVTIHIILACIIFVVGETLGVWAVNELLNFSKEKYVAANWVFQFSLLTFIFNIISIPYNAAIVAHEKMSAFAYISILEAILKLVIVYLLFISPWGKLVFYSFLMFLISVVIRSVYTIYCNRNFSECKYRWTWDKLQIKKILSYTGWNFLGSWAGTFRGQGVNMVLNHFYGASANAAQGISHHAMGALQGFVHNFQMAMNPQIIKRYAAGERESMFQLLFDGGRFSFILLLIISTPIVVEAPFILELWLKDVPEFAVQFFRIIVIISLIDSLSRNLITAMQASGIVRDSNVAIFVICLFTIPIAWVLFLCEKPPYYAAVAQLITACMALIVRGIILRKIIDFPFGRYFLEVILRMLVTFVVVTGIGYGIFSILECYKSEWFHVLGIVFIFIESLIVGSLIGFSHKERLAILSKGKHLLITKMKGK